METQNSFRSNWTRISNGSYVEDDIEIPMWARNLELCYLLLISLLGIPGNSLIISVELKNKHKVSVDYYVTAMAVFELICSSINVFSQAIGKTKMIWLEIASTAYCKCFVFTGYMSSMSTPFLLAAIAVDRYLKTCYPVRAQYNVKKAKYVCISVTVGSVLFAVPAVLTFHLDNYKNCTHNPNLKTLMDVWNKVLGFLVVGNFLIISFAYIKVFLLLRQRNKKRLSSNLQTQQLNLHAAVSRQHVSRIPFSLRLKRWKRHCKVFPAKPLNENSTFESRDQESIPQHPNLPPACVISEPICIISREKRKQKYITDKKYSYSNRVENISKNHYRQPCSCAVPEVRSVWCEVPYRRFVLHQRTLNRTTLIMFLITLIYFITYGLSSVMVMSNYSVLGKTIQSLSKTLKMINCVTNPLFFFVMSTKFRKSIMKSICLNQRW